MHAPDSQVMANTAGLLRAKSAMHEIGWLERTMEGADAAPCFLERLSEAMLQSFYDRFGGCSKLTKGWTGVYMADRGGRMRTRTAMLEISWLPRSLEGADASFWPANVFVYFSWVVRFFLLLGPRAHLVFNFYISCALSESRCRTGLAEDLHHHRRLLKTAEPSPSKAFFIHFFGG